jgi:POT family proton-dependent oligopeptide transporter
MFEGQPKGLYALALANTGERFGYYTMLAIFTLFLQAKFGYTAAETSTIFGCFLAAVYFIPFFGGILADKFGYGKMVTMGIVYRLRTACHPDFQRFRQSNDVWCTGSDCLRYRTF